LTDQGEKQLRNWLSSPIQQLPKEKHEILLKLFFGRNVRIEDNLAHVELHRERMQEILGVYKGIENYLKGDRCNDIFSGAICLVTGLVAAFSKKRRGRHTLFGEIYHGSYVLVFITALVTAVMHWDQSAFLFYIV